MIKILFICHGNICRSPAAEFVLRELLDRAGLGGEYTVASAATSSEEIGNPVYPPMRRVLAAHGLDCAGKTARKLRRRDYEDWDLLIGMDEENLWNMRRLFGGDEHRGDRQSDLSPGPTQAGGKGRARAGAPCPPDDGGGL